MDNIVRIHYMDNLRAFAMLLGVFFHAALAYSPMLHSVWLTADPQQSVVVDVLAYFSHTFRMPLFFIVAGFFAALLLQKRGLGGMLKNRLLRVTLPFAIFLPLILASFMLVVGWALESVEQKSPMLGMIAWMSQNPDAPAPPLTTAHLWFLYYLTLFYAIAFLAAKFVTFNWMRYLIKSPTLFVLLCPLILLPALLTQYSPLPAPEQFVPQLWSFGYFGLFFVFGWGLFKQPELLERLKPSGLVILIIGLLTYAVYFYLLPETITMENAMVQMSKTPDLSSEHILKSTLNAYTSVYICLALMIFGRAFFNRQSRWLRLIADSSYWVYIIHLPVLWWLQFLLLDTDYSLLTEFLIGSLGTIVIGMASYLALVRWTPIGWLLNGRYALQAKQQEVKDSAATLP